MPILPPKLSKILTTTPVRALVLVLLSATFSVPATAERSIIVQSTTSTQNSGFYRHVVPAFTAASGIEVRIVAVGTGQALKNARNCDADLLIVHAREAEQAFVDAGYGTGRVKLMYNDFVLVGPAHDPANIASTKTAAEAVRLIATTQSSFASRSDKSGTHRKEVALWQAANLTPDSSKSSWYRETGNGMGATLNFAVQSDSYTLTDRATWLAFNNKFDHRILFEGDRLLFNQYSIVSINPKHCPKVRAADAQEFAAWLLSPTGQTHISTLRTLGQQLFFPNAAE